MSTASSVKNNAARTDMIPPSMRRPIAIMEVSASLGSPSLAVSPRELILTGEELGSDRLDHGRLAGNSEIGGFTDDIGLDFIHDTFGMETDSCAY
jgi:hypothetical protein